MSYIKTRWVDDNTIITAAKLNNIETGVEEAHLQNEKTETAFNNIAADVPENFNTLKKICIAISNDSNIGQTVDTKVQALAEKADLVDQKSPKVYLDGERKSNFNFIENKVVQDGLICKVFESIILGGNNLVAKYFSSIDKACTLMYTGIFDFNKNLASAIYEFGTWNISNIALARVKDGLRIRYMSTNGTMLETKLTLPNIQNTYVTESVTIDNKDIYVYTNGVVAYIELVNIHSDAYNFKRIVLGSFQSTDYAVRGAIHNLALYDRLLTHQEIQHNFSILNNAESVKELHTGDKKLLLSTDSNHVEMATGRALEEEYTSLLKQHGKEFTSTGSAISIINGIKGKMLSGEIKGNTIKNVLIYGEWLKTNTAGTPVTYYATWDNEMNITIKSNNTTAKDIIRKALDVTQGKIYYIVGENDFSLSCHYQSTKTDASLTKISNKIYKIVPTDTDGLCFRLMTNVATPYRLGKLYVFEDNLPNVTFNTYLKPNTFYSTQTIINNNEQSYPIYEPTIVGKTRILKATKGTENWVEIDESETRDTVTYDYKLDSISDLGSIGTVNDYIDRARKVKVVNTKEIVLNGSEGWTSYWEQNNTIVFLNAIILSGKSSGVSSLTCSTFFTYSGSQIAAIDYECVTSNSENSSYLYVRINKSKLNSVDVSGFKTYLKSNPVTVRYQLAATVEIPLADEELKTYDAYKKVILLPFAEDKLLINEDGSATWNKAYIKANTKDFTKGWVSLYPTETKITYATTELDTVLSTGTFYCDKIDGKLYIGNSPKLRFEVDIAKFPTIESFKEYIQTQSPTVMAPAISTITIIPKELMPTISTTDKINTLSVDSPVSPSEFKAVVPVDKLGDLEQRLTELNSVLLSDANANLVYNYIETEYNKNKDKEVDIICQQN